MMDAMEAGDSRRQAPPRLCVVRIGEGDRRPNAAEVAAMRILSVPRTSIPPRRRERLDRQLELPFGEAGRREGPQTEQAASG